jgi:hypothetical protein
MTKIDGGTKDNGSKNLDEVDLVRVGEGGFDIGCDTAGETDVDTGDTASEEETLMRHERLLRRGKRTCTHRLVLENVSGTERENEGIDATLDEEARVDLVVDELGVAEIGLGLMDGFEVAPVFGRWEVSDEQLWSFGKRC